MKKINFIFAAVILLFAAVFSSCGSTGSSALIGPKDTWCRKDIVYKADNGIETNLRVYFLYSDEGITNPQLQDGISVGSGLTIAVCSTSSTSDSVFSKNTYFVKTYGKGDNTETSGSGETASFTVSDNVWTAVYINSFNEFAENGISKDVPAELQKGSAYKAASLDSLKNFSLKKLLAQYLLDNWLSE